MNQPTILYTKTDEAPMLATYSLLPIIQAYTAKAGINVELRDISLAGRILANFSDHLTEEQRVPDALAELGELTQDPGVNIIKLPNISASVPQLKAAIAELQSKGFALPDYPEEPQTDADRDVLRRYNAVKGSAVNPVLREGNSDRRAPKAVKEYARRNPHSMGAWAADSTSDVATMTGGDFRHNEQSVTVSAATTVRIEFHAADGQVAVLKDGLALQAGEIIDGTFMSKKALLAFLEAQVDRAKSEGLLLSLHMKATMMKVSDPIIFGHAVRVFFADVFAKHSAVLDDIGVDVNNGLGDLLAKLDQLPAATRAAIEADVAAAYDSGPDLAMVNSYKGITNLHVPSDVIIDASMPAMIRTSGQMWNKDDETQPTLAVIPDSSYSGLYKAVFEDCKANGAYDPTTMGSVPNVGLMAKKAEEYGSHDKTFEMTEDGTVKIVDVNSGEALISHDVEAGDIWRACQVKDAPIRDWVKLAISRARATGAPAVFWLDAERAHDAQVIAKVKKYLPEHDLQGVETHILNVVDATRLSVERIRKGQDTISCTGNVLRDYLTDLFPILEVGTSAKMLSIVPLMKGGGLFETGAGGSAPKHIQQLQKEGHLRWDALGEFLALAVSLDHLGETFDNAAARTLGAALDEATTQYMLNNKSPSRKVNEHDNRGAHYSLAFYWAEALAAQRREPGLADVFKPVATALAAKEAAINAELLAAQGAPVNIGGYYLPDDALVTRQMRCSVTLNAIIDSI